MKNVCIVGVGLIGGSLGMALRRRGYHVMGLGRSNAALKTAKRLGAVDGFSTQAKIAAGAADIVVLCVPVEKMVAVAKTLRPIMKRGAVLTDVGSVKKEIVSRLGGKFFVGGHPIAGSEKAGVQNAKTGLFQGAVCVLTRELSSPKSLSVITRLWKDAGAKVVVTSAAQHDRTLALTSHLPHLLAFSLFSLVQHDRSARALAGPSFQEMTRIAASHPDIWTGILTMNRRELTRRVKEFSSSLHSLLRQGPARLRKTLVQIERAKRAW